MTLVSDRKQDILRAAIGLIVTGGVASFTIRKVADAAGISTGLVLYHFESKEKLIEEAWRSTVLGLGERINEELGPIRGRDWIEATFRVRFLEQDQINAPSLLWLEYWTHISRAAELRLDHSAGYAKWREVEIERLRQSLDDGTLRSELDPSLIVDMFHTVVCGLLVKTAIDSETITAERAFELGKFFLSLISPASQPPET